jgi:hypothetical protein
MFSGLLNHIMVFQGLQGSHQVWNIGALRLQLIDTESGGVGSQGLQYRRLAGSSLAGLVPDTFKIVTTIAEQVSRKIKSLRRSRMVSLTNSFINVKSTTPVLSDYAVRRAGIYQEHP